MIRLAFAALIAMAHASAAGCTAFVDVTVVGTERQELLPHRTVVVRGSRIAEITAGVAPPRGCETIDGRHRYLIPGLTDAHLHLPLVNEADQRLVLDLLLANGITTAINMEGSPEIARLRDRIATGEIAAPRIYTTGPFIQEPSFETAAQVRREVEAQKRAGYDFVKVHGDLPRDAEDALFETARQLGLRVVGHLPGNLGIDAALGRQSLIVHAEEFLYAYFQFHRDLPRDPAEVDRMAQEVAKRTVASGTWVSPTLYVFRQILWQAADLDALLQRPDMRYLPRRLTTGEAVGAPQFGWFAPANPYVKRWTPEKVPVLRAQVAVLQRLVRALRDAGSPLLAGTDDFVPCVLPGFAMKDEMEQLAEAGLTPFEALQAATWNPARFLGTTADAESVAAGKRSDLVLVEADPMDSVANVFRRAGVMLGGRWRTEDELQKTIAAAK